jgi:hypothetical protein
MVIPVMAGILFSKKDSTDKPQEARLLHFGTAVLIGLRLVFGFMMAMYFGRTTGGSNKEGPEDIRYLCYGNSPRWSHSFLVITLARKRLSNGRGVSFRSLVARRLL